MREVAGKVALITGGVSGIGLGIARAFAQAGMRLAITYRREAHLREALCALSEWPAAQVHPIQLDVLDRKAVERAGEEAERVFGKIHILCNNAGVNLTGPMDQATYEDWDWALGVNLGGVINTLVSILPRLKRHGEGGHVVNVGSMSAFVSGPGAGLYATTKFAVRGLSECLRFDLAPSGIGVSLVCPGLTQSNIHEASLHRPPHLAHTGFELTETQLQRLKEIHLLGMDCDVIGRKTLEAVLCNRFYVFSHPEFLDEVHDACEEILSEFPLEEPDARRLELEKMRRAMTEQARRAIAAL